MPQSYSSRNLDASTRISSLEYKNSVKITICFDFQEDNNIAYDYIRECSNPKAISKNREKCEMILTFQNI